MSDVCLKDAKVGTCLPFLLSSTSFAAEGDGGLGAASGVGLKEANFGAAGLFSIMVERPLIRPDGASHSSKTGPLVAMPSKAC